MNKTKDAHGVKGAIKFDIQDAITADIIRMKIYDEFTCKDPVWEWIKKVWHKYLKFLRGEQ